MDCVYYAIGDVHGELDRLVELHREIDRYHAELHQERSRVLVHLGDYVDRGPESAGVLTFLMERSHATDFICLKGNHEVMMLDALRHNHRVDWWRHHGGDQTLASYDSASLDDVREDHLDWIDRLPTFLHVPSRKLYFVHAAIDPEVFPQEDIQRHLWGRSEEFFNSPNWTNPRLNGYTVIHGHTPTENHSPEVSEDRRRINIDTGAVYGGPLTAVALVSGWPPAFLTA